MPIQNDQNHLSLEVVRDDATKTLAVMVATDVFLNAKYAEKRKPAVTEMMQYLGSKLGVTHADIARLSPKLGSQISEALGSAIGSDSGSNSQRRKSAAVAGPDEDSKKKRPKNTGNGNGSTATRKRGKQTEGES